MPTSPMIKETLDLDNLSNGLDSSSSGTSGNANRPKQIGLFCGASSVVSDKYLVAAREFGREVARRSMSLIYGGGNGGLMGAVATVVSEAGLPVIGIVPEFMAEYMNEGGQIGKTRIVDSMHTRKAQLNQLSDVIVVLPGGLGTMDELLETMTWLQLGLLCKPIALLNIYGFFDGFLALLDNMVKEGFLKQQDAEILIVENNIEKLFERLEMQWTQLKDKDALPLLGKDRLATLYHNHPKLTIMLQQFIEKRDHLRSATSQTDLVILGNIGPFIALFQSVETTGPIIGAALDAVTALLQGNLFSMSEKEEDGHSEIQAFSMLVSAIAGCRFEATDPLIDEIVLLKLVNFLFLALLRANISKDGSMAGALSDAQVCEILVTIFTICSQNRLGESLRRASELAVSEIAIGLFGRLGEFVQATLPDTVNLAKERPHILLSAERKSISTPISQIVPNPLVEIEAFDSMSITTEKTAEDHSSVEKSMEADNDESHLPYGMPTLIELMRFLVSLLENAENSVGERMQLLSLSILVKIVATTGDCLSDCQPLMLLLSDDVCKQLILLVASENTQILAATLQLSSIIFGQYRYRLKFQYEHYLSTLLPLVLRTLTRPKQSTLRELYLEHLQLLISFEGFWSDMYIFYECNINYPRTLESLITTLVKLATADSQGAADKTAELAAKIIMEMVERLCPAEVPESLQSSEMEPSKMAEARRLKLLYQESVVKFNANPKEGFAFLEEHGLLSKSRSPEDVAKFLRRTPGLNKRTVGEYIAKPEHKPILEAFLGLFDFGGLSIDEGLRLLLSHFRLPGEAQQIDRILETFAARFYQTSPSFIADIDAAHILAFSVIMLNTDQHNVSVRRRMTHDDFIRNNRQLNAGKDFEKEYLAGIYGRINRREIVMPEEREVEAFDHQWNELVQRAKEVADDKDIIVPSGDNTSLALLSENIFLLIWHSVTGCLLKRLFRQRSDGTAVNSTLISIDHLAKLAGKYQISECLDELAAGLWTATSLREAFSSTTGNQAVRYLSRSENTRLVLSTFLSTISTCGHSVRSQGWKMFMECVMILHESALFTIEDLEIEQIASLQKSSPKSTASNDTWLLSTLSQYLTPLEEGPHSQLADPETMKIMAEFVGSLKIGDLFRDSRFLEAAALSALVEAMILLTAKKSSVVQPKTPSTKPIIWSDETMITATELLVYVALQNRDRLTLLWPLEYDCLVGLAEDSDYPITVRQHAVLGLGRLAIRITDREDMQEDLVRIFEIFSTLPPSVICSIASPLTVLILRILETNPSALRSGDLWPHYFSITALICRVKPSSAYAFGLLGAILDEREMKFPVEFFGEFLDMLAGFVASCKTGDTDHERGERERGAPFMGEKLSALELATRAIKQIAILDTHISQQEREKMITPERSWCDYRLSLFSAISQQCYHPIREIRQNSFSLLQKLVLSYAFEKDAASRLYDIYRLVLFPLLDELIKPEARRLAQKAGGMEEIEMRLGTLLCKTLLQNLHVLPTTSSPQSGEFLPFWQKLLQSLINLLHQSQSSVLVMESVPESIKNMLLVMITAGILKAPAYVEEPSSELWQATWKIIDPVIPDLKEDLFRATTPRPPSMLATNSEDGTSISNDGQLDSHETSANPTDHRSHEQSAEHLLPNQPNVSMI